MSAVTERPTLEQIAQAARILREATRDQSYQLLPLGEDVTVFLRHKRKRLTDWSFIAYESTLSKLALHFPDKRLEEFEPPLGTTYLEEWLEHYWGDQRSAYNRNRSIMRSFFKHFILRGRLHGDPTLAIEAAKPRQVHRETFSADERRAIIASQESLRDRICLRLLLDYGLRKGALRAVQFKHFDYARKTLTIFTKGQKVQELPLVSPELWTDLERHLLEAHAEPHHYLLPQTTSRYGVEDPAKPRGGTGVHNWWYRCLAEAGIVARGTTSGEKLHKARHTAGQRLFDASHGNLMAVQKLLGHSSVSTTADIYLDLDHAALAAALREVPE